MRLRCEKNRYKLANNLVESIISHVYIQRRGAHIPAPLTMASAVFQVYVLPVQVLIASLTLGIWLLWPK